jgi:WD40 repeat protein
MDKLRTTTPTWHATLLLVACLASPAQSQTISGSLGIHGGYYSYAGTLVIRLAAPGRNTGLQIGGRAVLYRGTLQIDIEPDFVPKIGQRFDVIVASAGVTGQHDVLDAPALPADRSYTVVHSSDRVTLSIVPAREGFGSPSPHRVMAVALAKNDELTTLGGKGQWLRSWEVGAPSLRPVKNHARDDGQAVRFAAFSHEGRWAAAVTADDSVEVWDAVAGKRVAVLGGERDHAVAAAFSPDGEVLAWAANRHTIHLHSFGGTSVPLRLEGHKGWVTCLAFSDDGQTLVSGSRDGTLRFWKSGDGRELRTIRATGGPIRAVTLWPKAERVAAIVGTDVIVWDARGEQLHELSIGGGQPTTITYSADAKCLVAGDAAGTLHMWDVLGTGIDPKRFGKRAVHRGAVSALACPASGTFCASAGVEGKVQIWKLPRLDLHRSLPSAAQAIDVLAFSPDGRCVARGGPGGTTQVWDIRGDVRLVEEQKTAPETLAALVLPKTGSFRSVTRRCELRYQQPPVDYPDRPIRAHWRVRHLLDQRPIYKAVALSPGGQTLAAATSDSVQVWDVGSRQCRGNVSLADSGQKSVAFSPSGRWLAIGGNGLLLLDLQASPPVSRSLTDAWIRSVAFSPDESSVAAADFDELVAIWELADGRETLRVEAPGVDDLLFTRDGCLLLTRGSHLTVWERATEQRLHQLEQSSSTAACLAQRADALLAGADDGSVRRQSLLPFAGEKLDVSAWTAADLLAAAKLLDKANGPAAYAAMWKLKLAGDRGANALDGLLKARPDDGSHSPERLRRLIGQLDDQDPAMRYRASVSLRRLGTSVHPELRRALDAAPTPRARDRLQILLYAQQSALPPDTLLALRAIHVLEWIGTPASQAILQRLADGAPWAPETQAAELAIFRLKRP